MSRSLLAPGCEKSPANPDVSYVPPNSAPYRVRAADSWWKLADRPEVKRAGLSALDLCVFNFRTRNPAEINWFLRNKVGCTQTTADRKNYKFSDDAMPGIVYLPAPNGSKSPISLDDPILVIGKPPAAGKEAPDVAATTEFVIEQQTRVVDLRHVRFRLKVIGRLTVDWGNTAPETRVKIAGSLKKREFSAAHEAQIAHSVSLQVGAKLDAKDLAKPKEWRKALTEGSSAMLKFKLDNRFIKSVNPTVLPSIDGLFFQVGVPTHDAVTIPLADLGFLLDIPADGTVAAVGRGSLEFVFQFGPSASAAQATRALLVNPGTVVIGGLAAWVAFCGYGIHHTLTKHDDTIWYGHYARGYVDAVIYPYREPGGPLLPKPGDTAKAREMARLGVEDAKATARELFGGLGVDPMAAYRRHYMAPFEMTGPGAEVEAHRALYDMVRQKLLKEKGIKI